MIKVWLMKKLLPLALDAIISALEEMVSRTDNEVDDRLVETIKENRDYIIDLVNSL